MGDQVETNLNEEKKPSEATPKIKYDWYQTETNVVLTVLLKNVNNEMINVQYSQHTLSLSVKLPSGSDYSLELDLAHEIIPDLCSYKVMPTKIEVKLKKLDGIRWTNLEGDPKFEVPKPIPKEFINGAVSATAAPKYPSSHKKAVDWDAVEREIKEQEKNENPEGEEALNRMFQQIYGTGSDEVKKAMNKSFLESGGTVLSTNWGDVGAKKVECKPPDGMEFKKWDS